MNVDLKRKFHQIHNENSPETRPFYCHFTTVTVSSPVLRCSGASRAECCCLFITIRTPRRRL